MKYLKKIRISLLILSVLIMTIGQTAFAADGEYTYTIKIFAGNQGTVSADGITVGTVDGTAVSATVTALGGGDQVIISGLRYGKDIVYIVPQDIATVTDSRYYAKGIRVAGRDNSEAENDIFNSTITGDRSYVIAYGISGDLVQYTVNYVDEAGNTLLASDTYYGNAGERQYVSSRYVDGYLPQAYNLVKTLSNNTAENIFDFVYRPITTEAAATTTPETTTTEAGTDADAGAAAAPGADADAGAAAAPGGEDLTAVPDEGVPQNLVDLDGEDEEVPLAKWNLDGQERPGTRMGYLPVYVGIGTAAVVGLIFAALYLNSRRRKAVAQNIQSGIVPDDIRNDE